MNKATKPLISIIVPIHNNAVDLPRCLDALINQTLADIEILCIDDASSDNTAEIIRNYEAKDPRVHGIISQEHLGVSEARNRGLEQATASYIMFCDGDDVYDATMCKKMFDKIQNTQPKVDMIASEIRIVYHAHSEMRMSDENYYSLHFSGYQIVNEKVLLETDLATTNKLFRKSLIDQYHLRFPKNLHYEDAYFCVAYMCVSNAIYYLNEKLYTYFRRLGSIMSNTWTRKGDNDTSIEHTYIALQLFSFLKKNDLLKKYNTAFWRLLLAFGYFSFNNSHSSQNTKEIRRVINNFLQAEQSYFQQTPVDLQAEIQQMIAQKTTPAKTRIKQVLIRFLPTYYLQSRNIVRLKSLQQRNQQLIELVETIKLNSRSEKL